MDYVRRGAETGHPWFRQRWTTGEADLTDRTNQWFETHHSTLHQALFN